MDVQDCKSPVSESSEEESISIQKILMMGYQGMTISPIYAKMCYHGRML